MKKGGCDTRPSYFVNIKRIPRGSVRRAFNAAGSGFPRVEAPCRLRFRPSCDGRRPYAALSLGLFRRLYFRFVHVEAGLLLGLVTAAMLDIRIVTGEQCIVGRSVGCQ